MRPFLSRGHRNRVRQSEVLQSARIALLNGEDRQTGIDLEAARLSHHGLTDLVALHFYCIEVTDPDICVANFLWSRADS